MKDDVIKFLNALYKNVKMGVQSIEELLPIIKCENLAIELTNQLSKYEVMSKEIEMIAKSEHVEIKDNSWVDKTMLCGSIKMKTLTDKSTQNIAQMFIIGSLMGIIDIIKEKSKAKDIPTSILEISDRLEAMQEENLDKLKQYLEFND